MTSTAPRPQPMHIRGTRRFSIALALLSATSLSALAAGEAHAQMAPASKAVKRPALDENGVDVITGGFSTSSGYLSIGQPSEGGLEFRRIWNKDGWYHSLVGTVSTGATSSQYVVRVGRSVESFTLASGVYQSDDALGSTLTYANSKYTYTTADGTVMVFENPGSAEYAYGGDRGILLSITRPDGHVTKFHYRYQSHCYKEPGMTCQPDYAVRLQSVTTNTGYQMKFEYAHNGGTATTALNSEFIDQWMQIVRVRGINNAIDYCDPAADVCSSLTQSWPLVTLARQVQSSLQWTDEITDALTNKTEGHVSGGSLASIKSPADPALDFSLTYDSAGRVASFSRGGGSWSYSYADSGNQRTTTVGQPLGGSKVYVSDKALLKLISMTDELGRTTSFAHDSFVRPTRVTQPEGNYTEVTYDARGNVTQTVSVAKSGSGLGNIVTSAAFAASCTNTKTCNKPTSTTDARGFTTDYTYDSTHGALLTATAPAPSTGAVRPQVRYSYSAVSAYYKNSSGSIVAAPSAVTKLTAISACQTQSSCAGTADEVKATIAYGSTGTANNLLPTSVSTGNGSGTLTSTEARAWDIFGNLTSIDGPLSGTADTSGFRYDAGRRLTMRVSPDPDGSGALQHRAQRLTYDADGNVTKLESGTTTTLTGSFAPLTSGERLELAYDALGRKVKQSLVSGSTSPTTHAVAQYSYDTKGRPLCTAQRMNPAEFGSLPTDACALDTAGSFGPDRISKSVYNSADEVTEARTAVGTTLEVAEKALSYTSNGQLQTLTDGENNRTTYEYDGHDRRLKTRYPSPTKGAGTSSTTDFEQLGYDAASNVTSHRLRDATSIAFGYDALNRLNLKDLPGTEPDVSYSWDNLGRLTGASQTGHALSFTYDALGRNLTQVGPQGTVSSQWDVAGRRTRLTYPGSGLYLDYDYLVTGEMAKIRENGATSGIGVLATFGHDDSGRRTGLTRGNGTVSTYGYDAASRLTSLAENLAGTTSDQSSTFSYSPASQISSLSRTNDSFAWTGHGSGTTNSVANGLNQLASVGGSATAHDARGNLTSDPTSGKTYGYSSENLLTSASGGVALGYDPLTRLHQLAGSGTTRFAYDGLDMIAEYDGSNALQRRLVHGPTMDEPLVQYEGSGTTDRRFLHADERGSIVAISDASGNMLSINRYDEYGKPQSTNAGRFQYTGQMWLPELGLYHYKARAYAPHLGRFLQTDPIGYWDGMNMYAYVGNDPVNFDDPLGLCDNCEQIVIGRRIRNEPGGGIARGAPGTIGRNPGGGGGGGGSSEETLNGAVCDAPLPDGSTINRNVDTIRSIIQHVDGSRQAGDPRGLGNLFAIGRWVALVQPRGNWDYKRHGGTEAQGNLNYGATGVLLLPMNILLRGAGAVQEDPRGQLPGSPLDLGPSTYGDDPKDIEQIKEGAVRCKGTNR